MSFTKHYIKILSNRTTLFCNQICDLLHLCIDIIYLSYNGQLYQQCHGCQFGFSVSLIVSNLYMEQFEHLSVSTYLYTGLQSWHIYVDDTFVVLHSDENDTFIRHINAFHPNIQITQVNISNKGLSSFSLISATLFQPFAYVSYSIISMLFMYAAFINTAIMTHKE